MLMSLYLSVYCGVSEAARQLNSQIVMSKCLYLGAVPQNNIGGNAPKIFGGIVPKIEAPSGKRH